MRMNSRRSTNEFSLSRSRENVLVRHVVAENGESIEINPAFRCVLRCICVLSDPERTDEQKIQLLMRWFFRNQFVPDALDLFIGFLNPGGETNADPAQMDFEQDADAIYASFMEQYGIDLMEVEDMHWRKFSALLSGLNEKTAFGRRLLLREMDTSHLKGEDRIKADRAKRRVALKEKMSSEEARLQKQLNDALARGESPAEALAALKAYYGGENNGV